MNLELLKFTENGQTATIHIKRFDNELFSLELILELIQLLHYLEDSAKYRLLIIRNSQSGSARGDEIDAGVLSRNINIEVFRKWEQMLRAIEKMNMVTLAVIEKHCFGAGLQLALACDMRIATDDSIFAHNEIKLGVLTGQAVFQLGKYCGLGRLKELIYSGKSYSAKDAVEWGIIHGSYAPSGLEGEIQNIQEEYKPIDIDKHMLMRRLTKEAFEMSYEDFLGCYLAAQYRVIDSLTDTDEPDKPIRDEVKTIG